MQYAEVAQLVEHHLAKVRVAGSNLVFRSFFSPRNCGVFFLAYNCTSKKQTPRPGGGTGRHAGLSSLISCRLFLNL